MNRRAIRMWMKDGRENIVSAIYTRCRNWLLMMDFPEKWSLLLETGSIKLDCLLGWVYRPYSPLSVMKTEMKQHVMKGINVKWSLEAFNSISEKPLPYVSAVLPYCTARTCCQGTGVLEQDNELMSNLVKIPCYYQLATSCQYHFLMSFLCRIYR